MTTDDDTPTAPTPPPRVTWPLVVLAWSAVALLIWLMQWGPANPPPPPCPVAPGRAQPLCPTPLGALWPVALGVAVLAAVAATVLASYMYLAHYVIDTADPATDPNEGDCQ